MKVLFVEQFGDLGGAQRCLLDLLPGLPSRWSPTVVSPADSGALAGRLDGLGVAHRAFPFGRYSAERKPLLEQARYLVESRRLASWLRERVAENEPDLVYVNGPRVLPAAVDAAGGRPVLFHAHNYVPQRAARMLLRRSLARTNVRVVSCCRHAAPAEDARVIDNGVPGPKTVSERPDEPRVGVLGRASPEKGQLEFVRAVRLLRSVPDLHAEVIGDVLFGDPQAESYAKNVRRESAGLPVRFTGWIDDVGAALDRLALLVVPSVREPATPRVILEAYARGLPVIAFASGGIPEILSDDHGGRLVGELTAEALAQAIEDALADAPRRKRWSAEARALWERRFTVERFQREVLQSMEDAVR